MHSFFPCAVAIFQGVEGVAWPGSRGLASKLATPEQQGNNLSLTSGHSY